MLWRLRAELASLIVPPACVACRLGLSAAGELLCADCRRGLPWLHAPCCRRCALPSPCGPCPAARAAWDRAWAPLAHAASARAIVTALKFRGALAIADAMAAQIVAVAPTELLEDPAAVLVPVPAHPNRARSRGFNPSQRLAAALRARRGLAISDCLRRRGPPSRQLGADRRERLDRGRLPIDAASEPPTAAILIDDVHTTGATLQACARALLGAGAERVDCLTYTRTLPAGAIFSRG